MSAPTTLDHAALDRWLTTDPRDEQDDFEWEKPCPLHPDCLKQEAHSGECYIEPDPCPLCEWVGCHEEECPNGG